jgi:inorganic pyrophosphatase
MDDENSARGNRSTTDPRLTHTGAVSITPARGLIEVTVEIPSGSRNKYEYDHARHRFVLDRVLYSSVHYPADYGFLEGTMAEDGDPLDVLVLIAEPTFPGCVVRARPIGVLDMTDDKGHDYKILAVAHDDPRWDRVESMADLAPHRLIEVENFFQTYKTLEKRESRVEGWLEIDDAWRIIDEAIELGATQEGDPGTWR